MDMPCLYGDSPFNGYILLKLNLDENSKQAHAVFAKRSVVLLIPDCDILSTVHTGSVY